MVYNLYNWQYHGANRSHHDIIPPTMLASNMIRDIQYAFIVGFVSHCPIVLCSRHVPRPFRQLC